MMQQRRRLNGHSKYNWCGLGEGCLNQVSHNICSVMCVFLSASPLVSILSHKEPFGSFVSRVFRDLNVRYGVNHSYWVCASLS